MTLQKALTLNMSNRISIDGLSYRVKEVTFTKDELKQEVFIDTAYDINTDLPYIVAKIFIKNIFVTFIIHN